MQTPLKIHIDTGIERRISEVVKKKKNFQGERVNLLEFQPRGKVIIVFPWGEEET